jgi:hypothetical protein
MQSNIPRIVISAIKPKFEVHNKTMLTRAFQVRRDHVRSPMVWILLCLWLLYPTFICDLPLGKHHSGAVKCRVAAFGALVVAALIAISIL